LDPSNANLKSGLTNAEARIEPDDDDEGPPELIPDGSFSGTSPGGEAGPGGMDDLLRNLGGGAGGGGMPDLTSMMNNPMMKQMAEQMMANGGLESLMSNPSVANMVSGPSVRRVCRL
jgi:small glutamine-rich tetratricopeptide repeat-containing protein alpha